MQLKMQTNYAIRILVCLSQAMAPVVTRELSQSLGIMENYLPKITQQLRRIGWIESASGVNGGFRLLEKPENITLLDVMRAMEGSVYINRCLEEDTYCSRNATAKCPVRKVFIGFQQMTEWYFSSISIADLSGKTRENALDDFYLRLRRDVLQAIGNRQSDIDC